MLERMRDIGCVDEATKIVTTHHAESGGASHTRLEEFFTPLGVQVGYDGLALEV